MAILFAIVHATKLHILLVYQLIHIYMYCLDTQGNTILLDHQVSKIIPEVSMDDIVCMCVCVGLYVSYVCIHVHMYACVFTLVFLCVFMSCKS